MLILNMLSLYCSLLNATLELQATVTEEDGMESIAHRFLSAAVKVYSTQMIVLS